MLDWCGRLCVCGWYSHDGLSDGTGGTHNAAQDARRSQANATVSTHVCVCVCIMVAVLECRWSQLDNANFKRELHVCCIVHRVMYSCICQSLSLSLCRFTNAHSFQHTHTHTCIPIHNVACEFQFPFVFLVWNPSWDTMPLVTFGPSSRENTF